MSKPSVWSKDSKIWVVSERMRVGQAAGLRDASCEQG